MTERAPTDAAIVKGFQRYEEAMNTALALLRIQPERVYEHNMQAVGIAQDNFYRAHREYRVMAIAAQARIDAKKGGAK